MPRQEEEEKKGSEQPEDDSKNYKMMSFTGLFKYQPWSDKTLVVLGVLLAIVGGAAAPLIALIFGQLIDIFDPNKSVAEVNEAYKMLAMWMGIIAGVMWFAGYFQYAFLQHMAERLSFDLRSRYLRALLKQETAYFEKIQVEALPSEIADHFSAISEGIGEKVGQVIYTGAMALGGIIIAFYVSWMYTLICFAYMPIIFFGFAIFGKSMKTNQSLKLAAVKELGGRTEETLSALKLMVSFNREELACKEFDEIAQNTKNKAILSAKSMAGMMGFFMCAMFGFFCYAYYIGSVLIQKNMVEPGTGKKVDIDLIVSASQATILGMLTTSQLIPILPGVTKALMSAKKIFDVIERTPEIRSKETGTVNLLSLKKGIRFDNVSFRYPTQPEKTQDIFEGINFTIKSGTSTAIVGPSGSGKSTIV